MKKYFSLVASLLLTAPLAQGQQPGAGGAGQSGAQSGTQGTQSGVQAPGAAQSPETVAPANPSQPGVGGRESTIFNEPAGANQPQPRPFGGTNQVQFGGTNRVLPSTNQGAFGTNAPGSPINEGAGATTNQTQSGFTNQTGNIADQAFTQQMRAVLARPGATQIFFPQTRSTISVLNQNGALVLQGFVSSEEEKRSIETRIQNTPGVTSIDNQLQVGTGVNRGITPRTPGINPAPNSQVDPNQRRLLNP